MRDKTNTAKSSKEEVAYKLAQQIFSFEAANNVAPKGDGKAFREYYLDLYAECLVATGGSTRRKT
ncbi:hypothetical protein SAMN04488056_10320 [Cohaesibacter marisflavi]|uniref:Uncharacterized protein n=1 Tax=Cohaesibacter marisflavi TaxID=655353 RepID=A0A1I5E3X0_9HYPH|nr:hypothetical protein [Cohaesibacter marisflavi]SFO06244.1 hypothetical protein SAMN04488056_10320 [Cohaesibacter marisflavi]